MVYQTPPSRGASNSQLKPLLTLLYDEFLQSFYDIKNKCPGKDKINKKILNALPQVAIKCLYNSYVQILSTENIPKSWNEVIIKSILKPMKPENQPTSHRLISLLSFPRKIFEKLLKNNLERFMEKNNWLSPHQDGFKKFRSLNDYHSALNKRIINGISRKGFLVCLFLDIKGAYNFVDLNKLRQALKECEVPDKMVNLIFNLFHTKVIFVNFNGKTSGPRISYLGLMQSSVLSPLLYLIYTKSVHRCLSHCMIIEFIDSIVLIN